MKNKILGGRYRIQDRIGEGGMAFVYLALDEKLGRRVAIKVLHEHMEKNEDIRKRFQMEAQAISSLDHPNIVKIYDFSGDESERLWIVTEVIRGQNLAQLVQKQPNQSLHPVPAACIVREICKALHKAHTTGIVHRDIKPENVMITNEGRLKLMDFGIAKDMQKSNLTLTGTFMGSPSYMSPEQIRGRDVDNRSDIYSLGVLFYEIVTGKLPYTGQTTHDVVMRIMEGEFTYPRFLIPTLAPEVDTAIVRAMQKEASRRFQSITEFGEAIDSFLTTYGHVESHVELERYFKDRKAYEERLKKSAALGSVDGPVPVPGTSGTADQASRKTAAHLTGHATGIRGGRVNPRSATTRDRASHSPISSHNGNNGNSNANHGNRQATPNAASHNHGHQLPNVAATAHIPSHRNSQIMRREHVEDPTIVPVTKTVEAATEYIPAQQKTNRTLPPRAFPHVKRAQAAVSRQAPPRAHFDEPKKHVRPRVPHRSMIRQRAIPREQYKAPPEAHQYLFGFLLVGIIVALTLWGFWELQNRISDQPVRAPRNVEKAFKNEGQRKNQRAQKDKGGSSLTTNQNIDTEDGTASLPISNSSSTHKQSTDVPQQQYIRKAPVTTHTSQKPPTQTSVSPSKNRPTVSSAAASSSTKRPTIVALNPDQATKTEPKTEVKTDTKVDTKPDAKPDRKKDSKPTQQTAGKGEVNVSSQPASEIWIDGKKVGTTVDQTSGSGWISLAAGNHSLELRRSGYENWTENFVVEGGEKKKFPLIALEKTSRTATAPESYSLTITARPVPAQVSIRNLETGHTENFTLSDENKTLELPSGRYQVRVERNGEVKERKLNLTGSTRSLTFGAEFKDSPE